MDEQDEGQYLAGTLEALAGKQSAPKIYWKKLRTRLSLWFAIKKIKFLFFIEKKINRSLDTIQRKYKDDVSERDGIDLMISQFTAQANWQDFVKAATKVPGKNAGLDFHSPQEIPTPASYLDRKRE